MAALRYIFLFFSENLINMENVENEKIDDSMNDIKEIFEKIHYNISCLKQLIEKLNNAKN